MKIEIIETGKQILYDLRNAHEVLALEQRTNKQPQIHENWHGEFNPVDKIYSDDFADLDRAKVEPFIGYLKVLENEQIKILYFCRHNSTAILCEKISTDDVEYISLKAPLGNAASYIPGKTFKGVKGREFKIVEQGSFFPQLYNWDTIRNRFLLTNTNPMAFASMRKIIRNPELLNSTIETSSPVLHETITLNDVAILDNIQDDLIRLDINSQMIIHGIAGTGKTTTIAKRIAIKNSISNWSDNESKLLFDKGYKAAIEKDERNWVLFTPSKKMKQYLEKALEAEGIPLDYHNIVDWNSHLLSMVKEMSKELHITYHIEEIPIQTEMKKGNSGSISSNKYQEYLIKHIQKLCVNLPQITENNFSLHLPLKNFNNALTWVNKFTLLNAKSSEAPEQYNQFISHVYSLVNHYQKIKSNSESEIDLIVQEIMKIDPNLVKIRSFFPDLGKIPKLFTNKNAANIRSLVLVIFDNYDTFQLSLSYPHKELEQKLRRGKIYLQFVKEYKGIFDFLSVLLYNNFYYFLQFSEEYADNRLNKATKIISKDLFLIYLANVLENIYIFFREGYHKEYNVSCTKFMSNRYYAQIYIDEAEEFTAHEIACMSFLAYPPVSSICISGDLLQRTKLNTIKHWRELSNFQYSIKYKKNLLTTVYRNSNKILNVVNEISSKINSSRGCNKSIYTIEGFPLLYYKYTSINDLCAWIINRIFEIQTSFDKQINKATIAILTQSDESITKLHTCLQGNSFNLNFVQILKDDFIDENRIIITKLEYVKGIEFDGVIIADVDRLGAKDSNIINYFYASITRANSYVGVTYNTEFPKQFAYLFKYFETGNWSKISLKS